MTYVLFLCRMAEIKFVRERLQTPLGGIITRWECERYIIPLQIVEVHEDTPHEELEFVAANTGEFLGC